MSQLLIALFDKANLLSSADLWRMSFALEENAKHCAQAWGLPAPAIVVCRREEDLIEGAAPIVFVSDNDGDPGALAGHYWDPTRGAPAGRVYVDRSSGLNSGSQSICEAAAHEVVEALCNPRLRHWSQHPRPERAALGVDVAVEVADPVQDTYEVHVDHPGATGTWRVANFVLPAWFRTSTQPHERVDYAGRLSSPGEIGPDGYAVLRGYGPDGRRVIWHEDATGQVFGALSGRKAHPFGRAQQLLAAARAGEP